MTTDEKNAMTDDGADMSKYLDNGNEARIKAVYESRDPRLMNTIITPYSEYLGAMVAQICLSPYDGLSVPTSILRTI